MDKEMRLTLNLREMLVLAKALYKGTQHMVRLEEREDIYPQFGEHAEPSDRADMQELQKHPAFAGFIGMFEESDRYVAAREGTAPYGGGTKVQLDETKVVEEDEGGC